MRRSRLAFRSARGAHERFVARGRRRQAGGSAGNTAATEPTEFAHRCTYSSSAVPEIGLKVAYGFQVSKTGSRTAHLCTIHEALTRESLRSGTIAIWTFRRRRASECMLISTEASQTRLYAARGRRLALSELPFGPGDVTAGSEDELQAVVAGESAFCDLPAAIRESKFYRNLSKRISSGEAPRQTYLEIEKFLSDSGEVWENSWIRFPESRLSTPALETFRADLGMQPGNECQAHAHRCLSVTASCMRGGPGCGCRSVMP